MSVFLLQIEPDALLAMEKHRADELHRSFPDAGGSISVPLTSVDRSENFFLDVSCSRFNLTKSKFQNRARTTIVLARVDIGGAPHRNPDGVEVSCPHIHLYREGSGDRWAFPALATDFSNPSSQWQTLADFMRFCHVTRQPEIERGLFTT